MLKKIALALAGSLLAATAVHAATDYPSKPIRIVIPYTAGGGTDSLMRVLSEEMQKDLGQPIVIENKPGASTMIGARHVAQAAPDGYTVLVSTHGTFILTPHAQPDAAFSPDTDTDYVATLGETATVLFTATDSGMNTFEDFMKRAKEKELSYANSGVGNVTHMAAEFLKEDLGIELLSVPFKGVEGAVAVAAGQVDIGFNGESAIVSLMNGGKLRPLAVLQEERSPTLPDVPSIKELGYDRSAGLLLNAAVPRGTPPEIIAKLEAAFKNVLEKPEIIEKLQFARTAPKFLTAKETEALMAKMRAEYEKVFVANGIPYHR